MDKSVEATRGRVRDRAHRAAPARPARPRRASTTTAPQTPLQAARDDLRARGAPAHGPPYDKSSIKAIEKAIMESDLGLTPNNDGNVIRLDDPGADRGAPQGARQGRARHRRGGPRRDPQHPPRHHARPARAARARARSAPTTSTAPRPSCRSSPTRSVAELDDAAEGQGRGDPRGVTAAARRALRRDHHRRQRALGRSSAGCRCTEGHRAGRRRRQGAPARRRRARGRGADRLLVLDRELVAPARGGRRR